MAMSAREINNANRILQDHIWKLYENQSFQEEWRNLPEIPTRAEICPPDKALVESADDIEEARNPRNWNKYQEEPSYDQNLPHNIVDGPWPSKEAYLGAHYQILREDAIAPLRRAVAAFKKFPALEDDNETCVYTDVRAPS
jgi:helicase required for RNAi-mediated heterochromatin assembly 1